MERSNPNVGPPNGCPGCHGPVRVGFGYIHSEFLCSNPVCVCGKNGLGQPGPFPSPSMAPPLPNDPAWS